MNELVKLTESQDVAVITIHNPPVNAVSPGVPEGISAAIAASLANPAIKAMVVIGAGQTFIAGADIREFQKIVSGERPPLQLLPFLLSIEDSTKPVVMAIHGTAFGGGLEIAMAGHYRVIAPSAQVGQPEVKLGLIPGMAGTQRLPRLAGVAAAVEMCAFGEPVPAHQAINWGIADKMIEGDFLAGAVSFAREIAHLTPCKTRQLDEKLRNVDNQIFARARQTALKAKRGQRAPLAAIEAIEAATRLPFEEGCSLEQESFRACLQSTESKALIHVFFGERIVGKIPGLRTDTLYPIQSAAVVGAGTMGRGIAMTFANAGFPVLMKDTAQPALDQAMAAIRQTYSTSVAKGRLSKAVSDQRLALIKPQLGYDGFEAVDIIVEAVFERMSMKKQVFAEMDKVAKPSCILATNTSTLDIDEIGSATSRPEMVIGAHFFSPANVMRLLELVRGKRTSDQVISTAMVLAKKLKKVAVLARNGFGFIGNRMVVPYVREAQFLVEEGASVEQVNQALYDFGMPMGPLAMDDLAGLDVMYHIREESHTIEPAGARRPLIAEELYRMGRLGQKTAAGWSTYDENRKPHPAPEVEALAERVSAEAGIRRRQIQDQEIVERCVYALINEGAKVLEEGIALRSVDIDIVYLNGYGFPAWCGGPMFYAGTVGLKNIIQRIVVFGNEHDARLWEPARLLKRLAEQGRTFESWDESPSR